MKIVRKNSKFWGKLKSWDKQLKLRGKSFVLLFSRQIRLPYIIHVYIMEHFHSHQKRTFINKCTFKIIFEYLWVFVFPSSQVRGPLSGFLKYGHPTLAAFLSSSRELDFKPNQINCESSWGRWNLALKVDFYNLIFIPDECFHWTCHIEML